MFVHENDKVSSIRLKSNSTKGTDVEDKEVIGIILAYVDEYQTEELKTKCVDQCTNSDGVGSTEVKEYGMTTLR